VAPQPFSQFPLQQFKERKHFENESRAILREAARQLVEEGELDDQIFTVSREAKAPKDAIVAEGSEKKHHHAKWKEKEEIPLTKNVCFCLLAVAVARDVDLIVMGRRGLGPLKQFWLLFLSVSPGSDPSDLLFSLLPLPALLVGYLWAQTVCTWPNMLTAQWWSFIKTVNNLSVIVDENKMRNNIKGLFVLTQTNEGGAGYKQRELWWWFSRCWTCLRWKASYYLWGFGVLPKHPH